MVDEITEIMAKYGCCADEADEIYNQRHGINTDPWHRQIGSAD